MPDWEDRLPPPDLVGEAILEKVDYFTDVHLWPGRQVLDPKGWLGNFAAHEREHAYCLLNVFLFVHESVGDWLFRSAFQSLSADTVSEATTYQHAVDAWRNFSRSVIATFVEGEDPHVTDSGLLFVRKARQVLGLREEQILAPSDAIATLRRNPHRPVLFLDDFVGSGRQMRETWFRTVRVPGGEEWSFSRATQELGAPALYTPLVCTQYGFNELSRECPELIVRPCHFLDNRYSLVHDDSILWPEHLRGTAAEFLFEASERAGIVDAMGLQYEGFHRLGLALAFWHSVPDATLPIFYWEHGWVPLVRRT